MVGVHAAAHPPLHASWTLTSIIHAVRRTPRTAGISEGEGKGGRRIGRTSVLL